MKRMHKLLAKCVLGKHLKRFHLVTKLGLANPTQKSLTCPLRCHLLANRQLADGWLTVSFGSCSSLFPMNYFVVSLKDVWLDKEHHKRVWIWQDQIKGNRPDIKRCAWRLKQPRPNDKMVYSHFEMVVESQRFTPWWNNDNNYVIGILTGILCVEWTVCKAKILFNCFLFWFYGD